MQHKPTNSHKKRAQDDLKWSPLLPGCGTQHPHRALGGTRVLLAAAPTTPPCFRRWRRSSSLLAIFSGRIIFNFGIAERLRTLRYPIFPREVAAGNGIYSTNFFAIKTKTPERLSAFRCLLDSNHFACGWVASLRRALSRIFSSVCSLRMCSALQASSAAVCSSTPSCTKKWVSSWWRL